MGKYADRHFKVLPWEVTEEGFSTDYGRVSESIFSLGNEYMGVRGYFEEGYSGDSLLGSYLNGVYEERTTEKSAYKGITNRSTFMVNAVDWLYTRIIIDEEELDVFKSNISFFKRTLDMKTGVLTRELIWNTSSGKSIKITFKRFLSMVSPKLGCQKIELEPLDFDGETKVKLGLDFGTIHEMMNESFWTVCKAENNSNRVSVLGRTIKSGHCVYAGFKAACQDNVEEKQFSINKVNGIEYTVNLIRGKKSSIEKIVAIHADKRVRALLPNVWYEGNKIADKLCNISFEEALKENVEYWANMWNTFDIKIDGDTENQQGIRYCIFQLNQTYKGHSGNTSLNIGAKGLTGEAYSGHAFWDTETYCLPFYLFNNPAAARDLLEFRYSTLPQAIERAKQLDCIGACYPIATLDGTESCNLWQHASLQFQPSTGVAYGIWHYVKTTDDLDFLYGKGIEMLVQICRFLADRGQYSGKNGQFGYYGVMGPDEFQMMVNNNCYTNFMALKTFEYTIEVLQKMASDINEVYQNILIKLRFDTNEIDKWKKLISNMKIPLDKSTGIYEQHEGFFDLPHIDIKSIPATDFPLYHNWSYDRIYRNDMIKQPDVLMFMFLYNQEFSLESKKVNYEYYEPRCIHESSLSPSIHSVFASELGKHNEAFDFFSFATRMDLDNYNRNTREGLHITSLAAAWVNIVYGFGGMRSDGDELIFNPSIPKKWESYSFRIIYRGSIIDVNVSKNEATFKTLVGKEICTNIYGHAYTIHNEITRVIIPDYWRA